MPGGTSKGQMLWFFGAVNTIKTALSTIVSKTIFPDESNKLLLRATLVERTQEKRTFRVTTERSCRYMHALGIVIFYTFEKMLPFLCWRCGGATQHYMVAKKPCCGIYVHCTGSVASPLLSASLYVWPEQ